MQVSCCEATATKQIINNIKPYMYFLFRSSGGKIYAHSISAYKTWHSGNTWQIKIQMKWETELILTDNFASLLFSGKKCYRWKAFVVAFFSGNF